MSTQTVTVSSFQNVTGNVTRLQFSTLLPFTVADTVKVDIVGSSGLEWNFVGYNGNSGYGYDTITIDRYWYGSGVTIDISSETYLANTVTWELWIRFSDNRVITPSDITSANIVLATEDTGWYMTNRGISNHNFIKDVEKYLEEPYPLSIWQCDSMVDNGMAHVPLFPDAVKINPQPIKQSPYVVIYDIRTPQSQLIVQKNNGNAILTPTVCEDTEELSGMWFLQLEHPIDPEHRWKLIQEGNIVRAGGQLFTIKQTEEVWEGSTGRVTAYCEHIWYQYGDNWIFADPINIVHFSSHSVAEALYNINSRLTEKTYISGGVQYAFTGEGDIHGFAYGRRFYVDMTAGCTPIELILGENGIIPSMGGELHRDNFYYSIYTRKETAKDNAFDIRVGKNLTGIRRTVDTTTMCTYYRLTDAETGMWNNIGWDTAAYEIPYWRNFLPHHIVRSEIINISSEVKDRFGYLCQVMEAKFQENCMPLICYEIDMEDVRNNPDFEISADESIRVGDIGTLYDERIGGALEIEVTSTTYDHITGKCKSITVGNKQSFVYHGGMSYIRDADGNIIRPSQLGYELWVQDSTGRYLYDSTGRKIVIKKEDDE